MGWIRDIRSGYGYRGQKSSGSKIPDPDPQHCNNISEWNLIKPLKFMNTAKDIEFFFFIRQTSPKSQHFKETREILRCSIRLFQWGKKIIGSIFLPVCYAFDMKVLDSGNQLEEIFLCRKFRHPQIWLNPEHSVRKRYFLRIVRPMWKQSYELLKWETRLVEALYCTSTCQKARHHCSTPGKCTEASHRTCRCNK